MNSQNTLRRGSRRRRHFLRPTFALVLALVIVGVPLWLVIATMGKSTADAQIPNLRPPAHWELWANLKGAMTQGDVLQGLLNSALVVVPTVVLVLLLAAMAAWIFARRPGKASTALYALTISGIVLPPTVITMVLLLRYLGLAESRLGLICAYTAVYLSIAVFFMTGFVRTIPTELEEAAQIDGAGTLTVFWRIVFPLLSPVIATTAIMVTLFAWNDVFYAFFVLGSQDSTLPLNLYQVASSQLYLNNWNLIFAFVFLMSIPLLVVFMAGQRRIIAGITSGAVK